MYSMTPPVSISECIAAKPSQVRSATGAPKTVNQHPRLGQVVLQCSMHSYFMIANASYYKWEGNLGRIQSKTVECFKKIVHLQHQDLN